MKQKRRKGGSPRAGPGRHLGGRKKKLKRPNPVTSNPKDSEVRGVKKLLLLQKFRFRELRYNVQKVTWRSVRKYYPILILLALVLLFIAAYKLLIGIPLSHPVLALIIEHILFKLIFPGRA